MTLAPRGLSVGLGANAEGIGFFYNPETTTAAWSKRQTSRFFVMQHEQAAFSDKPRLRHSLVYDSSAQRRAERASSVAAISRDEM